MSRKDKIEISIVLTGYYFRNQDLYKKNFDETKLYDSINFNLYILSHKSKNEISDDIYNYLIENNWEIIYQPNIGWDWGCHVQFMQWYNKQNLNAPDYFLFLHDDISIFKNGFIQAFLNKVKSGFELIGNSLPFTIINSFEQDYADEAFILENNGFEFETGEIEIVRGSAFFITHDLAVKTLSNLPYQKCGSIHLANRSLRMFGAIATHLVGNNKIGYLSEEHFKSDYISEEMRGEGVSSLFFIKRFLFSKITRALNLVKITASKYIYKHTYSINKYYGLKINITENKILFGYLNLSVEKSCCSDISFDDLDILFRQNKIQQVLTSFEIANDSKLFKKLILNKITESKIPVDLFVEAENSKNNEFEKFLSKHKNLKIKIEKIPKRKGTKWVKRLYIKYPQENLRPE